MKIILHQIVRIGFIILGLGTVLSQDGQPINTIPKDPWEDGESATTIQQPSKNVPKEEPPVAVESVPVTSEKNVSAPIKIPEGRTNPELQELEQLHGSTGGFNRTFELRAGPQFSMLWGKIRPGKVGSSQVDLRNDLHMKDISVGPLLDVEIQFSQKTHMILSYAQSSFSGQMTTNQTLFYDGIFLGTRGTNPVGSLASGSNIKSSLDIGVFYGALRYDVIKTDFITFAPLIGFKVAFLDENTTIAKSTGGTIITHTNLNTITPILGFDARFQFDPHFYFGVTPIGFALDKYSYFGGQSFLHFDFNKDFGLRLGLDVNYVNALRTNDNNFSTTTVLGSAFLQGVYGF